MQTTFPRSGMYTSLFRTGMTRDDWDDWDDYIFVEIPTIAISVSLTIKIHKNVMDTSSVTSKQFYKIVLL